MADVSVEFGAKDVGLEDSLKKIQSEMQSLEDKVKSGELSFEELESTMKRLSQVDRLEKQLQAIGEKSDGASKQVDTLGKEIKTAGDKSSEAGGIFDESFQKISGAITLGNIAAEGFQKIVELAFDAAAKVVEGFSDALDLGGRLNELSQRTGEASGTLLVLETAFKNSGLEAAQVGTAINKLQNFMVDAADEGSRQANAMDDLGIAMADLKGKTPTEQMEVFADKIAGIEDPTERAAAASEVFGEKLGGKLLPLFTDFNGNLDDARDKVGSLEEVMNENAATFDSAAETIEAIKGKLTAFAAGVLSETIPALEDLGKEMEQVDAAGLGQDVGEVLAPGLEKFSYFLIGVNEDLKELIDLFDVSKEPSNAFESVIKTIVDTISEFSDAMQKTINFISPMDDLFNALEQKGRDAAASQDDLSDSLDKTGKNASDSSSSIQTASDAVEALGEKSDSSKTSLESIGKSATEAGESLDSAFSLTSDFAPKLDEISESWGGVNDQILTGKNLLSENINLTDSMTRSVDEQSASFVGISENLDSILAAEKQSEESKRVSKDLADLIDKTYGEHAEKLAEIQAKQDELTDKENERKNKLSEALHFELAINEAKAAGDTELVKTLENQKLFNDELKKAIDAGMGEPQARDFADQMVKAKDAAAEIENRDVVITVTTDIDDSTWKDLLAELSANSNPEAIKVALEITGKDTLQEAYQTLEDMETINKNFEAAMEVSGARSLEEVKQNLEGIPTEAQRQLALEITGEDDLDDAIKKLDDFKGTKTAKALLEKEGFENVDQLQDALEGIAGEKRTDMIVEALGVEDAEAARDAIDAILNADSKKATITADADVSTAEQKIDDLSKKTATIPLDGDTSPLKTALDEFTSTAQKLTLDASEAISNIRADLEKPIKLDLEGATSSGGGGGSEGGTSGLTGLVEDIKTLLTTLSQKLPTPALA
jgi:hypothetical protein